MTGAGILARVLALDPEALIFLARLARPAEIPEGTLTDAAGRGLLDEGLAWLTDEEEEE